MSIRPSFPAKQSSPQGVVIAGRLTDPRFASAAKRALDGLCAGARPIEPRPVITGDKAKDIATALAAVDKAFAR